MFNIFKSSTKEWEGKNFYSFSARNSNGEEIPMSSYVGKVVLVLNLPSQYEEAEPSLADENFKQLNELDKRYRDQGLVILGFPTNQFGGKEAVLQEEIISFIKRKWNVDFEIFQKIDVNGDNTAPVFDYLKNILTGTITNDLKWHFTKFLIDRNGNPVKRYAPNDPPFSFEEDLRHLLRQESVFKSTEGQQQGQLGQQQGQSQQAAMGMPGQSTQSTSLHNTYLQGQTMTQEKDKPIGLQQARNEGKVEDRTQYQGNLGQTQFNLEKTSTKESEMARDRELEESKLKSKGAFESGAEPQKQGWEKEKQPGEKGKLGEGGYVGAQMGVHLGGHQIQTGIQAGKAQEQQK